MASYLDGGATDPDLLAHVPCPEELTRRVQTLGECVQASLVRLAKR